ncbi:THO complex subunit 2-like [Halichondria panicea]|uniref:THO complex subunit 2-like n=1 Tax=Halichondria panicea TaxID=6063 RepID=UPI00312BB32E
MTRPLLYSRTYSPLGHMEPTVVAWHAVRPAQALCDWGTRRTGCGHLYLRTHIYIHAETISNENKDERTAFVSVITALMKTVGEPLLKERLEMETLEQVSLVPSARNFNQKYVKTKTKLFYKQQKFNLFREENEG